MGNQSAIWSTVLIGVSIMCLLAYFPPVYGQSFENVITLSDRNHGAACQGIKTSGNNIYVAWSDGEDMVFRRSTDGGNNFGSITVLSTSPGSTSACPMIALTGDNIFIVWNEANENGNFEVYFSKSSNAGANFSPVKNLSHNSGDSSFPNIASAGMRVYVVWDDDTLPGDFMAFFTRSPDSGTSFGPVKNLVKPPINEALNARVAVSGHTVYVIWTGNAGGLNQVYMRISNDGGNNFGSTKPLVMASLIRDGAISRPLETMSMSYGKARSRLEMKILYLEKVQIKDRPLAVR